jgi:hypothetical protein
MQARLKLAVVQPDCMSYPCQEDCCSAGCDVWPREREALLARGLAQDTDFSAPYRDDEGDLLFRTALGARGCVFLLAADRGCRLHDTGFKPEVCIVMPRDAAEAAEMADEGMLPCRASWRF